MVSSTLVTKCYHGTDTTQNDFFWRPHRLTARTSGFHPGNRGSIPLGVTMTSHFMSDSGTGLVIEEEYQDADT